MATGRKTWSFFSLFASAKRKRASGQSDELSPSSQTDSPSTKRARLGPATTQWHLDSRDLHPDYVRIADGQYDFSKLVNAALETKDPPAFAGLNVGTYRIPPEEREKRTDAEMSGKVFMFPTPSGGNKALSEESSWRPAFRSVTNAEVPERHITLIEELRKDERFTGSQKYKQACPTQTMTQNAWDAFLMTAYFKILPEELPKQKKVLAWLEQQSQNRSQVDELKDGDKSSEDEDESWDDVVESWDNEDESSSYSQQQLAGVPMAGTTRSNTGQSADHASSPFTSSQRQQQAGNLHQSNKPSTLQQTQNTYIHSPLANQYLANMQVIPVSAPYAGLNPQALRKKHQFKPPRDDDDDDLPVFRPVSARTATSKQRHIQNTGDLGDPHQQSEKQKEADLINFEYQWKEYSEAITAYQKYKASHQRLSVGLEEIRDAAEFLKEKEMAHPGFGYERVCEEIQLFGQVLCTKSP